MVEYDWIRIPPPLSEPTVSNAQSHKNTPFTLCNSVQKSSKVLVLSPVLRRAPVISSQFNVVLETGVEEDGLHHYDPPC